MKVKMLEHYQDAKVHFHPEQEVEVDHVLGAWLVEHRKAVAVEVKHLEVEPQFEAAEPPPHPKEDKPQTFRKPKRSRGAK